MTTYLGRPQIWKPLALTKDEAMQSENFNFVEHRARENDLVAHSCARPDKPGAGDGVETISWSGSSGRDGATR